MKTLLVATFSLAFSGVLSAQQPAEAPTTQQKVEKIIFPRVKFQDATIEQALEYLRVKSRDLDTITPPPAAKGVSIVLRGGAMTDTISLDLKDAPLLEVLRYCAERVGLQFRVENHAVVLAASFEEKPAPPAATPPPVLGNADQIIFPTVQFRDATIPQRPNTSVPSRVTLIPAKQGVNIVVKPGGPMPKSPSICATSLCLTRWVTLPTSADTSSARTASLTSSPL
jgi:hypothetical protein